MKQELINNIISRALAEAGRLNIPITISIVDPGGHLLGMCRQADCSYFAIEASRKKALTASQLKLPTHILGNIGNQFPELKRSLELNRDIELLPGGFPVNISGNIIGGIGVSGGNFEQDKSIGEFALS